ncbi:RNaseH domain-containing protein [Streptomyces sp. NPDC056663]|uniref:RNaseH domain-containing protein n=1 Tax=Streptomyces sp. NPDC056663 TaxID=3345899 RepID=UPI00368AEDC5
MRAPGCPGAAREGTPPQDAERRHPHEHRRRRGAPVRSRPPGDRPGHRERVHLKTPWWAVTSTEIYPVGIADGVDRTMLARATARLCHQTIAWADRSRYPVPLHAAKQLDLDHPRYRRSAPPEEQGEEAADE